MALLYLLSARKKEETVRQEAKEGQTTAHPRRKVIIPRGGYRVVLTKK